jgi:tRNA dimethylallyltransferase
MSSAGLNTSQYDILVITGPTASGKTALAAAVADALGGEIISADSRQVYRGMDLGTGKDYGDYVVNGRSVPYHLVDIVDPGYKYNVFEYQSDFRKVYEEMKRREVFPVICGGSGMYVDSVVKGYRMFEVPPDPVLREELDKKPMKELREILANYRKLHNKTDIDTKKRVIRAIEIEHFHRYRKDKKTEFPFLRSLVTAVKIDRELRRERITARLRQRLDAGMVDEVRGLLYKGVPESTMIYYGLEYKYITLYLKNRMSYDDMVDKLETAIHQFAKRQMTWFRGMERRGTSIIWIDGELPMQEKVEKILGLL